MNFKKCRPENEKCRPENDTPQSQCYSISTAIPHPDRTLYIDGTAYGRMIWDIGHQSYRVAFNDSNTYFSLDELLAISLEVRIQNDLAKH